MSAVYVIAAELHGQFTGRPKTPLFGMMADAAKKALLSASVEPEAVDAIYAGAQGNFDPEGYVGPIPIRLANTLGLRNADVTPLLVGSSEAGAWALRQAYEAMKRSSSLNTVLVLAGEQMNPVAAAEGSGSSSAERIARNQSISEILDEKERHYGLNMVRMGDLLMDLVRHHDGWTQEQLKTIYLPLVAMTKYQRVDAYPLGHLYGKVAPLLAKYHSRPPLTTYLNLDDVTPTSSGAVALVLSTDPCVESLEICGMGQAFEPISMASRDGSLSSSSSIALALWRACRDANVSLSWLLGCDFAVLHDAFPSIEYFFLKELGLEPESILDRATSGWSNPFGGLKTCGHALGASGLLQVAKAYQRMFLRADYLSKSAVEQWPEARRCFATSVGGPLTNVVVSILAKPGHGPVPTSPQPALSNAERPPSASRDEAFEALTGSIQAGCGLVLARTQIYHNPDFGDDEVPLLRTVHNPWIYLLQRSAADQDLGPKSFAFSTEAIDVGSIVTTKQVTYRGQTYLEVEEQKGTIEPTKVPPIKEDALERFKQRLTKY